MTADKLDLLARGRSSASTLRGVERIAALFARGARKAMPFLTRYRARVGAGTIELTSRAALLEGMTRPTYEVALAGRNPLEWARVILNADAIVLLLEGSLGGTTAPAPTELDLPLTAAQRALTGRVVKSIAAALCDALREEAGLELRVVGEVEAEDAQGDKGNEAFRVSCNIEGVDASPCIVIAMGAESIDAAVRERLTEGVSVGDPRIGDSLPEVPLELVAELGRVTLGLARVLSLKEGDVIRLPTAVDDAVCVSVEGMEKFRAVPITSRGQLAVEIKSRHET